MRTGKNDISGWLVRPASRYEWAGLVAVLSTGAAHAAILTPGGGAGIAAASRVPVSLGMTACLALGWACALRLHRIPLHSRFTVLGLTGLVAGIALFGHLVPSGGRTVAAALALPLGLLLGSRGRWTAAGAVVGIAVALQPLLTPMALLFLFARRWRALGVLLLAPALVSWADGPLLPDPAA